MDYSLTSKFTLLSFQFLVSTALIQAVLEPVLVQTVSGLNMHVIYIMVSNNGDLERK